MGVLGTFRDSVTLINRTIGAGKFERNLNVRYDGEDINLLPGENHGFPKVAVPYAKNQNPLMGSKHPTDPRRFICMVGVKGTKDDCSPLDEETLERASRALEVLDRDGHFWDEPMRKVQLLKKTGYSPYEAGVHMPSEYDVNRNID